VRLQGSIDIPAAPSRVWAAVVDPAGLAGCVPGVQAFGAVDERTFDGRITAAVGPMEGDFTFRATIAEATYPDLLRVEVAGVDSVTRSRVEATVEAHLTSAADPDGAADAASVLGYRADIRIGGRLAILGEMILRATAGVMINQVADCLRRRLAADATGAAGPAGSAG
jgi:carbon monoxide dehydrogenase subunit G